MKPDTNVDNMAAIGCHQPHGGALRHPGHYELELAVPARRSILRWPDPVAHRVLADYDPERWQKSVRSLNQPLIREIQGRPGESAPAPRILSKPSWFIH